MRVLITGATGFVGSHLAEYLIAKKGVQVFGTYRWRSRTENIDQIHTGNDVLVATRLTLRRGFKSIDGDRGG